MIRNAIVIIDCSGSMAEIGKKQILLNANRILRRWATRPEFSGADISFYQWNGDITLWSRGGLQVQGSSNVRKLTEFIDQCIINSGILLLTDGCSSLDEIKEPLRKKNIILLPVAIGADADIRALERVSTTKQVYSVSMLTGVLERICFGTYQGARL